MKRPRADVAGNYPSAPVSIDEIPESLRLLIWSVRDRGLHFGGTRVAPLAPAAWAEMLSIHRRSKLTALSAEETARLAVLCAQAEDATVVVSWVLDADGLGRIHRMFCRRVQEGMPRHGLMFGWGDGWRGDGAARMACYDLAFALLTALFGHVDRGAADEVFGPVIVELGDTWHLPAALVRQGAAKHRLERAVDSAHREGVDVRAVVAAHLTKRTEAE